MYVDATSASPARQQFLDARRRKKDLRQLPRLVASAVTVVWRASPPLFAAAAAIALGGGLVAGGAVFAGRSVFSHIGPTLQRGDLGSVIPTFVAAGALLAAALIVGELSTDQHRMLSNKLQRMTFDQILDVTASVDLATFESPEFHDGVKRAETEGLVQPFTATQAVFSFLRGSIGVVAVGAALVTIAPMLVLLLMAGFIPIALISMLIARGEVEFQHQRTLGDRRRAYLRSVLVGRDEAKEVRAADSGALLRKWYEVLFDELLDNLRRHLRRRIVLNIVTAVAIVGALMFWLFALALLYTTGRITGADLAAGTLAMVLLATRIELLARSFGALYQASLFLSDYERFVQLKQQAPENPEPHAPTPPVAPFAELVVDNVTFTYPGAERTALRDVSLAIRAGEVIALVGENGSGKTTLAKLLALLYQPSAGQIRWDGHDASELDPRSVRENVAVIFQDFVRYQLSAYDNIGLGAPDHIEDPARVRDAAAQAGAAGLIEALPQGYDTILSKAFPGGSELSLGQWQRVALARAFVRQAPFIILDEPTAALDPRAEDELFSAIRTHFAGRTVLLISHRFSTVRTADRIYVMKAGAIVEIGSHAQLMRQDGLYAELFTLQARNYLDAPAPTASDW